MNIRAIYHVILLQLLTLSMLGCDPKRDTPATVQEITLSKQEVSFANTKASATISVNAGGAKWEARVNSDGKEWLSVKGVDNSLKLSVIENTGEDSRSTTVVVSAPGASAQLKVTQLGSKPVLHIVEHSKEAPTSGGSMTFSVTSNVEYKVIIPLDASSWIHSDNAELRAAGTVVDEWELEIKPNTSTADRSATIKVEEVGGGLLEELEITQPCYTEYPSDLKDVLQDDFKLIVTSAKASSWQPGEEIEKSYDGDYETIYHSKWQNQGSGYWPIVLEYFLKDTPDVDYIIYHPRKSGNDNGNFKEIELYVSTESHPEYVLVLKKDCGGTKRPTKLIFDEPIKGVKSFKFVVKSGAGDHIGFAACSEMEFYRKNSDNGDPLTLFTDATCSELKPGVTEEEINKVPNPLYQSIAAFMLKDKYPREFRIQDYKAWPHPSQWARECKTWEQNILDNPTGIVARKGQDLVVFVGDTGGHDLSLRVINFDKPGGDGFNDYSEYPITQGVNKIIPDKDGLVYVMYHTASYETAPKVRIHLATGDVNGYFDSEKHETREEWNRLLDGATYKFFDVLGKYAHITFPTDGFRRFTRSEGPELIGQYDEMIQLMTDFMGLKKYNRPKINRSYFHAVYTSYMYASPYHTAYNCSEDGVVKAMCSRQQFRQGPWGHSHETGHTFQHRPGFTWMGMTEVTNNLMANLINVKFGAGSRLQNESRYEAAYGHFFVDYSGIKSSSWSPRAYINSQEVYDIVFEKLVPLWQLYLYYTEVLGMDDFYPDIYEAIRVNNDPQGDARCQLEFTRLASEIAGEDLREFFTAWNFYTPFVGEAEDYARRMVDLNQQLIDQYLQEIGSMNLPAPAAAIQYITDNNVEIYKKRTPVSAGTYSVSGSKITISGCQNAVAYEAVLDGKVIAVVSSGDIKLPDEAIKNLSSITVNAISFDGQRVALARR
ncbi:MAG: M60 family metallopeptidase [Porphyromonas sp.]|nr:M60 family metallopeptidase [Porphyromonas sp.]